MTSLQSFPALMVGLSLVAGPIPAQQSGLLRLTDSAAWGLHSLTVHPPRPLQLGQHSVEPSFGSQPLAERLRPAQGTETHRIRNAAIGGVIGTATGLVLCTVISNLTNDPGTGFSTCTAKGYVFLGGGGLVLGAIIGYLIE